MAVLRPDNGWHTQSNNLEDDTTTETPLLRRNFQSSTSDHVEDFAQASKLIDRLDLVQKAAALVHGTAPDDIPNITPTELDALTWESEQKWRQPRMLYFSIFVCSLGAVEQGWAQTSMNGANLYFPKQFGIGSSSPRDNLLVGLINGGIYLSCGLVGAWLSEPFNGRFGRRGAIAAGTLLCLIGNFASTLSRGWLSLLLFRFVLGAGLGLNGSTVSVFAAECAPSAIRGALATTWQMFTAFGILLGFVANIAVFNVGPTIWRWQLAGPIIPTIPLLILISFCPESPAWYIKSTSQYDHAFKSLQLLRNTELQAARDLYSTYLSQEAGKIPNKRSTSFISRFIQLFTIPRIRRATIASYTVMLTQQLCGINILSFYSSSIFADAGFSNYGALLASSVFGLINFLGAFPAIWTMDALGRRSLLLLTLPFMAVTMFATGLSFNIPQENPAHFVVLATLIYLFCALYSPGAGPVPTAYSAEVFPLSHREIGMSFAVSVANLWATALSFTFPRIAAALHPQGAFILYAGLNVVAFVLVFLFVPETRLKTLDELDDVFAVPTWTHIRYQTRVYAPWVLKRYVLRQKTTELQPLVAET